ncbi:MAG: DNA polymerase III subunit gamma/tau [Lactobacillaceae bacterium]|jgi:DNA polymerase-3 subunit gamma/tau|nr:DNA polymerase III subunit gamma/tau [Lactobacillaceae bacterium]
MYKALYRQYRPTTFDDLVGQTEIATTLRNAIANNKVAHAYLFTGPRGTGKTSVAKIFARELNNVVPEMAEHDFADIIEIDAASNNGVDDARELIDSANYAPIELPYKVYIVDEVHMLSTSAFNALLKTIEEPPEQVKFILATTDPQKIPATILSRVQRFDFKRIDDSQIVSRLEYVLNDQAIEYELIALQTIANIADGGLRDALSILDQVISLSTENKITNDMVLKITGRSSFESVQELLLNALNGNTENALSLFNSLKKDGKDIISIVVSMVELIKDALVVDIDSNLISSNVELALKLSKLGNDILKKAVDLIADTLLKMKTSLRPEVYVEILLIKLDFSNQNVNNGESVIQQNDEGTKFIKEEDKLEQNQAQIENKISIEETKDIKNSNLNPITDVKLNVDSLSHINEQDNSEIDLKSSQSTSENATEHPPNHSEVSDVTLSDDSKTIFTIMKTADRNELVSSKEAWEEIKQSAENDFADLANFAKIVAANQTDLIVVFEQTQFLNLAINSAEFANKLKSEFEMVMGVDYNLTFLDQFEWNEYKSAFADNIKGIEHPLTFEKKLVKKNEKEISAVDNNQDVIMEAEKIFGDNFKLENN